MRGWSGSRTAWTRQPLYSPLLGVTATGEIARSDFGVLKFGHVPLAAGGFMVPDSVRITVDIEATRD